MAAQGDPESIAELADQPDLPEAAAHVWGYFIALCATRGAGAMGPSPLNRVEIQAWERDEAVGLQSWERRSILAIDGAWLKSVADQNTKT